MRRRSAASLVAVAACSVALEAQSGAPCSNALGPADAVPPICVPAVLTDGYR